MPEEQINNTAAYINLDILGSQNYIPYVSHTFLPLDSSEHAQFFTLRKQILRTNPTSELVKGRSEQIAKIFEKYFDQIGYKYAHTTTTDGTEHDAFAVKSGVAYGKETTPKK